MYKSCIFILCILSLSCCAKQHGNGTQTAPTVEISPAENEKTEHLTDPLILDGRPYVDSKGKAYRKDEAYLFEYLGCDFDSDAVIRWYSLEGTEQLFNLKRISIYGKNLEAVDFTPLASLSNLEELFIRGNVTRLPDLTGLENLLSVSITGSQLESLEGIGAPNARRIEIHSWKDIDSLSPLNNLFYLENLEITLPGETEYKIADMTNLPVLQSFEFSIGQSFEFSIGTIDLLGIENLSSLKDLRVSDCEPFHIEGIGKLKNLEFLIINIVSPEPSLEFLRDMPNLSRLGLYADNRRLFLLEFEASQILDVSPLATLKNLHDFSCCGFIIKNISALDALALSTDVNISSSHFIYLKKSRLYDETEKSRHWLVFEIYE
jgi:Leucine-rich repeat (LRR) protein